MKHVILFLLLVQPLLLRPGGDDPLAALEGIWYVQYSNFGMWLSGKKHFPAFTYTIAQKHGVAGLADVVSYQQKGRRREIRGFDAPQDLKGRQFTWRGNGLLHLFKSKWEILYNDGEWMLIHFRKTLVSAEGYDVISRQPVPDAETMQHIRQKLQELDVPTLTAVEQR